MSGAVGGVTQSQSDHFSDFSAETDFAKFKLIVEGKTLFVDQWDLAKRSPVFMEMIFSDGFKEKAEQTATIGEESHEDILNFLQCILPCSASGLKPKPITAAFVPSLMHLANKFMVKGLVAECERFILTDSPFGFSYADASDQQLVDMLVAAAKFHLSNEALVVIMGRVAAMGDWAPLASAPIDILDDLAQWQRVMTALVKAKDDRKLKHYMPAEAEQRVAGQMGKCAIVGCNFDEDAAFEDDVQAVWQCGRCQKWMCRTHGLTEVCLGVVAADNDVYKRFSLPIDMTLLQL